MGVTWTSVSLSSRDGAESPVSRLYTPFLLHSGYILFLRIPHTFESRCIARRRSGGEPVQVVRLHPLSYPGPNFRPVVVCRFRPFITRN